MTSTAAPLVGVVIPVYNGEEFIADAIRSVLARTYTNFDLTIAKQSQYRPAAVTSVNLVTR